MPVCANPYLILHISVVGTGDTGAPGVSGRDGNDGFPGPSGPDGLPGRAGFRGAVGKTTLSDRIFICTIELSERLVHMHALLTKLIIQGLLQAVFM